MNWLEDDTSLNLFYLASKESALVDPEYRYKIASPTVSVGGKKGNRTTIKMTVYHQKKMQQ